MDDRVELHRDPDAARPARADAAVSAACTDTAVAPARAHAAVAAAFERRVAPARPDGLLAELQQRRAGVDHRTGADHLRHHRGAFANSTGVPGQISFAIDPGVTGYSDAQFKADIVTAHGRGQKVVLSIGGQNGSISVSDSASATAFANSAASILTNYGFDGIDIDLENGINPSSMASAISQLEAMKPGALVTAAPQTLDTQNSQSSYFSFASMIGANMTMMNTQYYNSGSMLGCDGGVYSEGNENFVTALACTQLNGLPATEIGIGFPATTTAAGSGYVSPSVVVAAIQCLANGSNCGTFRPPTNHPTIRGVMTWSINWDASNGYQFANTVSPVLRALP